MVFMPFLVLPGFAPAGELVAWRVPKGATVVVEAKVTKAMLAVAWPFGCPARFANFGGTQSRYAQTTRAFSPKSAARLGLATRPRESMHV